MLRPKPIKPNLGQESVWDYPRPPRLESSPKRIQIIFNNITIVDSQNTQRVLETSHPPVYYIPPQDIKMEYMSNNGQKSFCEWKGNAIYYHLIVRNKQVSNVAWSYPYPNIDFLPLKNYIAFYAGPMDGCYVDGEKVTPQPGNFYAGWITNDIVGPFKGEPGSWGW